MVPSEAWLDGKSLPQTPQIVKSPRDIRGRQIGSRLEDDGDFRTGDEFRKEAKIDEAARRHAMVVQFA